MTDRERVALRIREARFSARMQAQELADFINLKMNSALTQQVIYNLENERTEPTFPMVVYIAEATGKPLSFFTH